MNNQQNENYQKWVNRRIEEEEEWENEMAEIEKEITAEPLSSNSKMKEIFESSDTVYLDFSGRSSRNLKHEENTLIIREFRKACDYIDRFGANIKKIIIDAENLESNEISSLMRIVIHNCTELNSMFLLFFKHGFSSDFEGTLPYIINTRIQACNFDAKTIMLLINCSEQIKIIN